MHKTLSLIVFGALAAATPAWSQAYQEEAAVEFGAEAVPMPIVPLEPGPPPPVRPPPPAPHFSVTSHPAAGAKMLVELEILDFGSHAADNAGGSATTAKIVRLTVDGEVRCVWPEDLVGLKRPMTLGEHRYVHVDKACQGKRIAIFLSNGAAAYARLADPDISAARLGKR